ncbi:K(+)-transporting ATPase subunit C [Amnibacterium kyonggiense]|uniref:Potassium-transporting ATPase KdpC subunit n=1 Tax=Amnibacterium kyonggiense TaxID=595671 RepID=A0A4R7FP58_9MICO|nr:K(+)-transporting ATPase subunit C [Amnibacterium kyonggiense]TDS79473.1 K+-transporting ATPase ATPase C chain [Amnibacterium kyonggiense]
MSSVLTRGPVRTWTVALRLLLLTTLATVVYTLVVTLIGQVVLPGQAHGSTVSVGGKVVGSALIGQSFTDAKGNALPQWFQSRPSAAGDGYDGGASSGSNLGPNSADLLKAIDERKAAIRESDGPGAIPADAVTASGSGLDPHISEAYALLQVDRVARARNLSAATVRALVERTVQAPDLGYLGQPTVNVLQLNIALAGLRA